MNSGYMINQKITLGEFIALSDRSSFTAEQLRGNAGVYVHTPSGEHLLSAGSPLRSSHYSNLIGQVKADYGLPSQGNIISSMERLNDLPRDSIISDAAAQLYEAFLQHLVSIDHPARFDLLIFKEAGIKDTEFEGHPVKDSFYSCPYPDGSSKSFLGGINHVHTYVIEGEEFSSDLDVLVRTGNSLGNIQPEVRQINEIGALAEFVAYRTISPSDELKARVDQALKLTESYESDPFEGKSHPLLLAINARLGGTHA